MDAKLSSAMDTAVSMGKVGRLASARDEMLGALNDCRDSLGKVFAAYNLGALFWSHIGDGEKARKFYRLLVEEADRLGIAKVQQAMPSIVGNTFENLMHLSLTYEEYSQWADRLRSIQPTDDVLRGMVPHIKDAQERGQPWSSVLESLAQDCYNRSDPSKDRGEYARANATYHLILLNRKAMRLSREAWSRVAYEFGTLALRVSDDACKTMERTGQRLDVGEFRFVVDDARPLVQEYLAANPSDEKIRWLMDHVDGYLEAVEKHGAARPDRGEVVAALNNEGTELLENRRFQAALAKFTEGERISREIGDREKLQVCLGNVALVALNTGDYQRALELTAEKERICRELGLHSSLAHAMANRAFTLELLHRRKEALAAAREAYQVCRQHGLDQLARQVTPLIERLK